MPLTRAETERLVFFDRSAKGRSEVVLGVHGRLIQSAEPVVIGESIEDLRVVTPTRCSVIPICSGLRHLIEDTAAGAAKFGTEQPCLYGHLSNLIFIAGDECRTAH